MLFFQLFERGFGIGWLNTNRLTCKMKRHVIYGYFVPVLHNNGPLQNIAQLPDVAGKFKIHQPIINVGLNTLEIFVVIGIIIIEKMIGKQSNVFTSLSKGRQFNLDHINAVIKIFSECFIIDLFNQIFIGSS